MPPELAPIAPGLWTDEPQPRLIAGRKDSGEIVFPLPEGDAGAVMEAVVLSRRGTLWSWTSQEFEPKEPYAGPKPFAPYLIGYVEIPGEVIVESRLIDTSLADLKLGMPMELAIVQFDGERATFAFRPEPQP
jgi:uncharacterized OB-fold protein